MTTRLTYRLNRVGRLKGRRSNALNYIEQRMRILKLLLETGDLMNGPAS